MHGGDRHSTNVRYVSSSIAFEWAREYVMSAILLFLEIIVIVATVAIGKGLARVMLANGTGS